jgi:nucleoside 2-deoxyribosyltransferase
MHVFLAGVMQGSRLDDEIDAQDYRQHISMLLRSHIPDVQIIDPHALHPDSVAYDLEATRQTFMTNTAMVHDADALIAYLPHASMGTAIEIWTAYHAKKPIVAVTPLEHNWVVRITADKVLPDLDSLRDYISSGAFARLVLGRLPAGRPAAVDGYRGAD